MQFLYFIAVHLLDAGLYFQKKPVQLFLAAGDIVHRPAILKGYYVNKISARPDFVICIRGRSGFSQSSGRRIPLPFDYG